MVLKRKTAHSQCVHFTTYPFHNVSILQCIHFTMYPSLPGHQHLTLNANTTIAARFRFSYTRLAQWPLQYL